MHVGSYVLENRDADPVACSPGENRVFPALQEKEKQSKKIKQQTGLSGQKELKSAQNLMKVR